MCSIYQPPAPSESSERSEDLVVVGLVPGVLEDLLVPDDAVLVDDEDGALGNPLEADHILVEDAVIPDRLLVEIAQQREREMLLVHERLQREKRVDADAIDLRVRLVQARHRVAERAELLLAHAAERSREKRQ